MVYCDYCVFGVLKNEDELLVVLDEVVEVVDVSFEVLLVEERLFDVFGFWVE